MRQNKNKKVEAPAEESSEEEEDDDREDDEEDYSSSGSNDLSRNYRGSKRGSTMKPKNGGVKTKSS
jgi:hypothetical protein